ncbi:MAG: methyltransferase, partial [Psychrosphaera sp.]|nr:methyltransferase [Psychrosphaera sp.]
MNTELNLLDRQLTLQRWPLAQKNRTLQAWDSADEYLIQHVEEQQWLNPQSRILLINDAFGALTCWFAGHQVFNLSDSYVAHQAVRHNYQENAQTTLEDEHLLGSMDDLPQDIDLVLIKVPKNNGFLEHVLSQINRFLPEGTKVIAAGKTTDIHSSTLKFFERFIGPTTTSLAKKKSRLIFATLSQSHQDNTADPKQPKKWALEGTDLTIVNHANVFSRDSLDIGARLLLSNLPKDTNGLSVVDLGCGNGVVGLSLLNQSPQTKVLFVDESYMAVASAQDSVALNVPDKVEQCRFVVDDCLTRQASDSVDLVVNNPPFHQQQA